MIALGKAWIDSEKSEPTTARRSSRLARWWRTRSPDPLLQVEQNLRRIAESQERIEHLLADLEYAAR